MSAMSWKPLRSFQGTVPPCENGCKTAAHARSVGRYQLFLAGHPAGHFCAPCRKGMTEGWESALSPVQEVAA